MTLQLVLLLSEVALRATRCGKDRDMVKAVMELFGETLIWLPASSVGVERLHANTQVNCQALKSGRRHEVIQQNSYVMSVHLDHAAIRKSLEQELFGTSKVQAGKLLARRIIDTTLPSRPVTNLREDQCLNPKMQSIEPFGLPIRTIFLIRIFSFTFGGDTTAAACTTPLAQVTLWVQGGNEAYEAQKKNLRNECLCPNTVERMWLAGWHRRLSSPC